jgi:hypothetical protein
MTGAITYIQLDEVDDYECECGATRYDEGFRHVYQPLGTDFIIDCEPHVILSIWSGLYACNKCDRLSMVKG